MMYKMVPESYENAPLMIPIIVQLIPTSW